MTVTDIRKAIEYNTEHRLYSDDSEFLRVYFTYEGGRYNGQRSGVKSLYYLLQLEEELERGDYTIKDIEIISTSDAWREWLPKEA